ncbi:cytochrome C oxidase subunit II [Corallococcus sp. BB11-1]|uniref:cytochrome c oxidase subunit II n=1 Tax=Corallococcus sp. BB11-1 TaxID=2996783 RepID=UPI0022709801|nr:cytochrome C oxidase subunit II [Corallococcus sp. BB11-1]MCY1030043.1 cytochrome C oxidase subunit II [Corallococcus sp. BB11-1]
MKPVSGPPVSALLASTAPAGSAEPAMPARPSTALAPPDAQAPLAVAPARGAWSLSLPENASAHGDRIDALLASSHRFEFALAAVMLGWLLVAVVRFRGARKVAPDGGTRRSRAWVLGLALGVFGVVDGSLFLGSESYLRDVLWNFRVPTEDPRTVRIEINAHQWSWEARYAGQDGTFGTKDDVVTWNDLRVPAGVPVWVQLVSTDVVHGFALPAFRVKLDAIPGRVNQTWFQAAREGAWEVACYQHCGTSHYRMRGVLTALSPEAYAAWLREAGRQAVQAYDADDTAAHWGWAWRTP